MAEIEILQTFYDARYTAPSVEFTVPVELPPNIIFFTDFAYRDLYGDALDPLDVPYPDIINPGDLILGVLEGRESTWGSFPVGWTTIVSTSVGGNAAISLAWKVATGDETGTVEVAQGASRTVCGGMLAFSGIDLDDPVADVQVASAYTDTVICPAATADNDRSLVVRAFGKRLDSPGTYEENDNYPANHIAVWNEATPPTPSGSAGGVAFIRDVGAGVVPAASWGQMVGESNAHIAATVVFNVKPS